MNLISLHFRGCVNYVLLKGIHIDFNHPHPGLDLCSNFSSLFAPKERIWLGLVNQRDISVHIHTYHPLAPLYNLGRLMTIFLLYSLLLGAVYL